MPYQFSEMVLNLPDWLVWPVFLLSMDWDPLFVRGVLIDWKQLFTLTDCSPVDIARAKVSKF